MCHGTPIKLEDRYRPGTDAKLFYLTGVQHAKVCIATCQETTCNHYTEDIKCELADFTTDIKTSYIVEGSSILKEDVYKKITLRERIERRLQGCSMLSVHVGLLLT